MTDAVSHFYVRKTSNRKAVVFVHGFSGNSHQTFGMLPAFLAGNPDCYSWDIHCFGYPTSLAPDISGVWSADPDLTKLSGYLKQNALDRFGDYDQVALIAHSMGGLIVQRALLDGGFDKRIALLLLFGTPSAGLRKAGLGRLFKKQARDMTADGDFVTGVRRDWTKQFASSVPFPFRAIAGISDEFVPANSSVEPFPEQYRGYVAGNHLEMVKPQTVENDTPLLVFKQLSALLSDKAHLERTPDPASSKYAQQVADLLPRKDQLDERSLKNLALALEMVGRQREAIQILRERHEGSTELTGVLAGRLKRLWLADPVTNAALGNEARQLYSVACREAEAKNDHPQAYYNGINEAFMALALGGSKEDAKEIAKLVIKHCDQSKPDKDPESGMWRLATEGEASLYLGDIPAAIQSYAAALDAGPDPRQVDSMYKQAIWAARALDDHEAEAQLAKLFEQHR